jgi:hypothetical protein
MASMNSAIRDQQGIFHIFLTVTEDLTCYPMVASQSFMTLIDVLRENAFRRNLGSTWKKD